ncbi:MAG: class I adenylate-forming enzyme family protein [Cyclonatronaceae bacterium]
MNTISQPSDPSAVFLKSSVRSVTYHELHCFAASMLQNVHDPSRPVGLLTTDRQKAILLIASAWINGITIVPLPATSSNPELADQIKRSGIHTLFCDASHMNFIKLPDVKFVSIDKVNSSPGPSSPAVCDDEQLFGIFFTSGSTGKPKAVPLKRRQLVSAARSVSVLTRLNTGEQWLHCLPLNHVGGVSVVLRSLLYGSGIYCATDFGIPHLAEIMSRNRDVKAVSLVPTQLTRLLGYPGFFPHNDFRFALIGGGWISEMVKSKAVGVLPVIYSFGMTESCAMIVAGVAGKSTPAGSTGRILPPNILTIRDESGNEIPNGQTGLICLKGPQIFDGYLDDDTDPFFDGGWFNTGDYGYADNDGFLFMEARREDRIVTGGENVDPREIESVLAAIPGIREAAVIGIPDEEWGQLVTAVVVTGSTDNITLKSVRNILKGQLSDYKIPRRLEVVDSLPKTALGKVKKGDLMARFTV